MSKTPEISVILPSHNGMKFLPTAVQSILQQTFTNFELILLDDGSTDETPQYAKTISDRRLRYVRLEKVGLVGALNTGLKLAKSDLIARMDADDIAISTRLARQHEMFRMDSQLIVASTGYEQIDEHGDLHCSQQTIPMPTTHAAIAFYALFSTPFLHPGSMFRREHALRAGGYNQTFDVAEDYDLWTRLLQYGKGVNIDEILLKYRTHSAKVSSNNREKQSQQAEAISGHYAASVVPNLKTHDWKVTRRLILNHAGCKTDARAACRAFQYSCAHFENQYPTSPELSLQINYWRNRLAYAASQQAKASFPNIRRMLTWLKIRRELHHRNKEISSKVKG